MLLKVVNKHGDMTDRHRDTRQSPEWGIRVTQDNGEHDHQAGEHGKIKGQKQMKLGHKGYRMGRQQDYNYIPAQETNDY